MKKEIKNAFTQALEVIRTFSDDYANIMFIEQISQDIADTFVSGGKVLICGNGGSAADAIHFAEEFTGNYLKKRKALPVISLTDAAHITCVGNDFGFEEIFARGVEAYGKKDDLLIALSTSGNSKNVIKAVRTAKDNNLKIYALLGKSGGELKEICDNHIIVKSEKTSRIQEVHQIILHTIIEVTENILYEKGYL